MDVASITTNLGQINVDIETPSSVSLLTTEFTPPATNSFSVIRGAGETANRNFFAVSGGSNSGVYETMHIRTAQAQVFQPLTTSPEAVLLDNYANGLSPVFQTKSFKGYFLPKVSGNVSLNFTTAGDGGFTKLLIQDTNGSTISNTSLMFGRNNTLTVTLNNASGPPTPWYIEATSGRNSYITFTVTGPADATPLLFSGSKSSVITMKAIAIGSPVSSFTSNVTSGIAPATINFTDTSINSPTSWSWNFGDGNTSTLQNPSNTYIKSGSYTVALTVSSPAGTDTHTATNYITVTDVLDADPRWGWNGDPLGEIANRGEGIDRTANSGFVCTPVDTRIPVMIKAPDGSIILITQPLTNFSDDYCFVARMKRSTDNGVTWTAPYDAYFDASFVGTSSGGASTTGNWISAGCAVVDYIGVNGNPKSITYFMANGDSSVQHHRVLVIRSVDNGVTWTNLSGTVGSASDITSSVNSNSPLQTIASVNTSTGEITLTAPHGFVQCQAIQFTTTGTLPSPLVAGVTYFAGVTGKPSNIFILYANGINASTSTSPISITTVGTGTHSVQIVWSWNTQTNQGIQLSSNSTHTGRLIVPGDHRSIGWDTPDVGTGTSYSHVLYSDDGGLTWGILGVLPTSDTNEATVIETTTANKLLMNVRFKGNTTRYQSFSTDGGATWGTAVSVPVMQQVSTWGSLQRFGNTLVLSTPYDTTETSRKQMTLFTSTNEGTTWTLAKTIFYRLSGYSSLVPLDAEHGLLAFETGISNLAQIVFNDTTSPGSLSNFNQSYYQAISLFAFNKTWLTGSPTVYADYFFNEHSTGQVNPYGANIIDYGGVLNARGFANSVTNTPSYGATGIALSSSTDDAIVLTEYADFNVNAGESVTIEVEATITSSSNGVLASNMIGGTHAGMRLECVGGVLQATINDGIISPVVATGVTNINNGSRHVYAMVRNIANNTLNVYIDGVSDVASPPVDSTGSLATTNSFYLGQNPSGTAQSLDAIFHSCRITKKTAVAPASLQVAPRTKITQSQFRNYTAPTPPSFDPTQLANLETWINASSDGGASGFADSQWSLTYPLPYYSGATIQSYRDKSPNRYFFNASEFGHNFYETDSVIGPHVRFQYNSYSGNTSRWSLEKAHNTVYTFVAGSGPNGNANFAIGFAIKMNGMINGNGSQIILDCQQGSGANGGFLFYIDSSAWKPAINIGGTPGQYNYVYSSMSGNLNDGNWHYLLFVGRGYGSPVDLYHTTYSGTYNPASPNLPGALVKYQSGNLTTPTQTVPAYYLAVGGRTDGNGNSNISMKNLVMYSNSAQILQQINKRNAIG